MKTEKLTNGEAGLTGMIVVAALLGVVGHLLGFGLVGAAIGALVGLFGGIHGNDPTWVEPK